MLVSGAHRVVSHHELNSTKAAKPLVFSPWFSIHSRINRNLVLHRWKIRRCTSTWREVWHIRWTLGSYIHDSLQQVWSIFWKQEVVDRRQLSLSRVNFAVWERRLTQKSLPVYTEVFYYQSSHPRIPDQTQFGRHARGASSIHLGHRWCLPALNRMPLHSTNHCPLFHNQVQ